MIILILWLVHFIPLDLINFHKLISIRTQVAGVLNNIYQSGAKALVGPA